MVPNSELAFEPVNVPIDTVSPLQALIIQLITNIRDGAELAPIISSFSAFFSTHLRAQITEEATTEDRIPLFLRVSPVIGGVLTTVLKDLEYSNEISNAVARFLAGKVSKTITGAGRCPTGWNIESLFKEMKTVVRQPRESEPRYEEVIRPMASPVITSHPVAPVPYIDLSDKSMDSHQSFEFGQLFPRFEPKMGPIHPQERHSAVKYSRELRLKQEFRGTSDSRFLRSILRQLKHIAEANCFNSLEYQMLLNFSLSETVREAVPDRICVTYEALSHNLERRVQQLLSLYAPAPEADKLLATHSLATFRQRENESLTDCIERFDRSVADLASLGVYKDDQGLALQFIEGLNPRFYQMGTTIYLSGEKYYHDLRNKLLVAERLDDRRSGNNTKRYESQRQRSDRNYNEKKTSETFKSYPQERSDGRITERQEEKTFNSSDKFISCRICNGTHQWKDCSVPVTKRRCTVCNNLGHIAAACQAPKPEGKSVSFTPSQPSNKAPVKDAHVVEVEIRTAEADKLNLTEQVIEVDQDQITDIASPMTLPCRIAESETIHALMDTGATCALISNSFANAIAPISRYPRSCEQLYRLHFANSTVEQRCKTVTLPLTIIKTDADKNYRIPFLIVNDLRRDVLLGRSALCEIGITLRFKDSSKPPPDIPYEGGGTQFIEVEACSVSADQDFFVPDDEAFQDQVYRQPTLVDSSLERSIRELLDEYLPVTDPVSRVIDEVSDDQIRTYISRGFEVISMAGWLPFADRYSINVTPVKDKFKRDCSDQEFFFTVRWQLTADEPIHKPWNSERSISGLDDSHRSEWDEHVDDFKHKEWWTPYSGHSNLTSTLFPVIQKDSKTTKTRPCADMRTLNSISPRVSAKTYSVSESVLQLRSFLKAYSYVTQYDLKKAFYRIRVQVLNSNLDQVPIVLKAGRDAYTSERLIFGLSVGPSGLNASQHITAEVCKRVALLFGQTPVPSIVVMDDFLFVGDKAQVQFYVRIFELAWTMTGFEFKKEAWSPEQPALWLGQRWLVSPTSLRMIRTPIEVIFPTKWTKRQAFKVAGKFTCLTLGFQEALARAHADQIRQISGRWESWDTPCQDSMQIKELCEHRKLALEHWNKSKDDDSGLCLIGDIEILQIESDASQKGYGYVIKADEKIVCCDAKIFPLTASAWHANRRELYCLSQSLLRIDALLQLFPNLKEIRAKTDSRVAVAHTDEFKNVSSKALERKAILRIRNAILELSYMWRTIGISFRIEHIPGNKNVIADELSRTTILSHEIAFLEIQHRFNEMQALPSFKTWLITRELFIIWKTGAMPPDPSLQEEPLWTRFLRAGQRSDSQCQKIYSRLQEDPEPSTKGELRYLSIREGLITRTYQGYHQVWLPENLTTEVIEHIHVQMGHSALGPTLSNFFTAAFHPQARKIARRLLRSCKACNYASDRTMRQTSYEPIKLPKRPFEVIGMDLYGPLLRPTGSRKTKSYVLTIVDRLTGYTRFILMKDSKAESVVKEFECFCLEVGCNIRVLITDNGTQFTESPLLKGLCLVRGITHITTPIYAPWTGGFYERRHRVATQCLRTLLVQFPISDWKVLVATAQAKVNSQVGDDRTSSPHELIYGWKFVYSSTGTLQQAVPEAIPDPFGSAEEEASRRSELRNQFLILWNEEFAKRQEEHAKAYERGGLVAEDERPLAIGDYVYFVNDTIKRKFAPKSTGPFRVVDIAGKNSWWVKADDAILPVKVHTLSLRLALGGVPQVNTEEPVAIELESAPSVEDDPTTEDDHNEHSAPPGKEVRRMLRTTREEKFLSAIQGQRSRGGRMRRGSLLTKN